jgi:hypothetical protein
VPWPSCIKGELDENGRCNVCMTEAGVPYSEKPPWNRRPKAGVSLSTPFDQITRTHR